MIRPADTLDAKRAAAIAWLGSKWILHPDFDGVANHNPARTDVAETIARVRREQAAQAEPVNVRQLRSK